MFTEQETNIYEWNNIQSVAALPADEGVMEASWNVGQWKEGKATGSAPIPTLTSNLEAKRNATVILTWSKFPNTKLHKIHNSAEKPFFLVMTFPYTQTLCPYITQFIVCIIKRQRFIFLRVIIRVYCEHYVT